MQGPLHKYMRLKHIKNNGILVDSQFQHILFLLTTEIITWGRGGFTRYKRSEIYLWLPSSGFTLKLESYNSVLSAQPYCLHNLNNKPINIERNA